MPLLEKAVGMNMVGFSPAPHLSTVLGNVDLVRSTTAQHASSIASVATNHWRAARVRSGETATTCAGSFRGVPVATSQSSEPVVVSPVR